jgi:anti-sigma factor RsiW
MPTDLHQHFQQKIDEAITSGLSADQDPALRDHLRSCAACTEYLVATSQSIAALTGFSFAVDPNLPTRVHAALQAQSLHTAAHRSYRPSRSSVYIAALVLTLAGSLAGLQFSGPLASLLDVSRTQMLQGMLAFWIAPSIGLLLLFPLLLHRSAASTRRHERIL